MIGLFPLVEVGYWSDPALTHAPTSAGRFALAPALMTPPLPEMVDSAPAGELAAAELSVETLELLLGDAELDCYAEERMEDAADELDDTAAVVVDFDVAAADVELTAFELAVAAGSEPPQPDIRTAIAAAAITTDRDARMRFMVATVTVDQLVSAGAGCGEYTRKGFPAASSSTR